MPYLSRLLINTPRLVSSRTRQPLPNIPCCVCVTQLWHTSPPVSFPFCVLVRQPRPTSRSLVPTLVLILSTFRPANVRHRRRPRSLSNRQPQTDSRPRLAFRSSSILSCVLDFLENTVLFLLPQSSHLELTRRPPVYVTTTLLGTRCTAGSVLKRQGCNFFTSRFYTAWELHCRTIAWLSVL